MGVTCPYRPSHPEGHLGSFSLLRKGLWEVQGTEAEVYFLLQREATLHRLQEAERSSGNAPIPSPTPAPMNTPE